MEQTRSEPQDQAFPPLSILDLPLDILVDIVERLSPMDLLRMSHTNQELRVAAMIVATPQERRIQVQAICGSPCNRASSSVSSSWPRGLVTPTTALRPCGASERAWQRLHLSSSGVSSSSPKGLSPGLRPLPWRASEQAWVADIARPVPYL
ncbi:F-box protein [Mesorhizobium australicum]|uniref:F-box protein n=1 Tax=Mesorhizobium sp. M0293 TaxID=2956930 RepID=UPI00333C0200